MAEGELQNTVPLMDDVSGGEAADIVPQVYDELKKVAIARMSSERPQTIGATALVHEAYLRLLKPADATQVQWENHRHFFCAAAEAMRRILIDRARSRNRQKRGGDLRRTDLALSQIVGPLPEDEVIEVGEALEKLSSLEPEIAEIVKLKYFVGLKWSEITEITGMSERTVRRQWAYARSWLHGEIQKQRSGSE